MNSSPWRLEGVDGGDEQYPVESRFALRHTPPDEKDPRFDHRAPTLVCFLRFAVHHTPSDQQDPVSTIGGPREVRFLRFAVHQTPPDEQDAVSYVPWYARPRFHQLFRPSRLAPDEQHVFRCLPMNTAHFVASP